MMYKRLCLRMREISTNNISSLDRNRLKVSFFAFLTRKRSFFEIEAQSTFI